MGGAPRSGVLESIVTRVAGDITAPAAAKITATYIDGVTADIPFVWVSEPIAAGFSRSIFQGGTGRGSIASRMARLFARDGRLIGRQSFHSSANRTERDHA